MGEVPSTTVILKDGGLISLDMIPQSPATVPEGPMTEFQLFSAVFSSEYNLGGVPPGNSPGYLGWLWTMLQYNPINLHWGDYTETDHPSCLDEYVRMQFQKDVASYNLADSASRSIILQFMRKRAHSTTRITLVDQPVYYNYNARSRLTVRACSPHRHRTCPSLRTVLEQLRQRSFSNDLLDGTINCFTCADTPPSVPRWMSMGVSDEEFLVILATALVGWSQNCTTTAVVQRCIQTTTIKIPDVAIGSALQFRYRG
jgi:hypothetical protein